MHDLGSRTSAAIGPSVTGLPDYRIIGGGQHSLANNHPLRRPPRMHVQRNAATHGNYIISVIRRNCRYHGACVLRHAKLDI